MEQQTRVIPFCSHHAEKAQRTSGDATHRFFSNWAIAAFMVDDTYYVCTEQYMMHKKALLFNDEDVAHTVIQLDYVPKNNEPDAKWDAQMKEIKALGRIVNNFDADQWSTQCVALMERGIYAKFSQNPHCRDALLATGNQLLCEAARYDKIWGIGLRPSDPRVHDPSQWQGKNLLGECLMVVRSTLYREQ